MQAFKKILVPVDGSANAHKALHSAIKIAKLCKSEIILLYVSYFDGDTDSSVEMVSWLPEVVTGSVNKTSNVILGQAKNQIPAGISTTICRKKGIPSQEILKFAQTNDIDLVVMGGRGLGIVEGYLLGSVSQYVLEHCKCPVMIVK